MDMIPFILDDLCFWDARSICLFFFSLQDLGAASPFHCSEVMMIFPFTLDLPLALFAMVSHKYGNFGSVLFA
jgi:hypothetical protein